MALDSFKHILGFTAWSLLATSVGAVCGPKQASNWSDPLGAYPCSPFRCRNLQTINDPIPVVDILKKFDVNAEDFLAWNCFLDDVDGGLVAGQQVCVNATNDGLGENPFQDWFDIGTEIPPKSEVSEWFGPFKRDVPVTAPKSSQESGLIQTVSKTTKTLPEGSDIILTGSFTTLTVHDEHPTSQSTPFLVTGPLPSFSVQNTESITTSPPSSSGLPDSKPTTIVPRGDVALRSQSQATESSTLNPTSTVDHFAVYTEACDSGTFFAENCHATMHCNTSRREYPMCVGGKCKCKVKPCSTNLECKDYKQCRSDDQKPTCKQEPQLYPEKDGICRCEPKIKGCLSKGDDKHKFCSSQLNCTEYRQFTNKPQIAQCIRGGRFDHDLGGLCKCKHLDCVHGAKLSDEWCNDMISCPGDEKGVCIMKFDLDVDPMEKDGYCGCNGGFGSSAWTSSMEAS